MGEPGLVTVADDATHQDWLRLILKGRVTVSSAARLHEAARSISTRGKNVIVCCADAEYLDVSVIQVLLCLGRDLVRRGKQCDITNIPDAIGELFRLAGLRNNDPQSS